MSDPHPPPRGQQMPYLGAPFPQQPQLSPSLAAKMMLVLDRGEAGYRGSGLLAGRRVLVMASGSGIGSPSGSADVHGGRWRRPGDHIHAEVDRVGELGVTLAGDQDGAGEGGDGEW